MINTSRVTLIYHMTIMMMMTMEMMMMMMVVMTLINILLLMIDFAPMDKKMIILWSVTDRATDGWKDRHRLVEMQWTHLKIRYVEVEKLMCVCRCVLYEPLFVLKVLNTDQTTTYGYKLQIQHCYFNWCKNKRNALPMCGSLLSKPRFRLAKILVTDK